jgi:hypothetical protein
MAFREHKYRLERSWNPHRSPTSEFATSVTVGSTPGWTGGARLLQVVRDGASADAESFGYLIALHALLAQLVDFSLLINGQSDAGAGLPLQLLLDGFDTLSA